MICGSFFSPHLTANFYISPWLPSLLSAGSLLLFSLSLWAWWSNVRLLDGSQDKINSKQESQNLRAHKALSKLRTAGPKLLRYAAVLIVGWGLNDIWQYNHTFVLWNLKVMAEPGDKVLDPADGKIKIVPERTFYFQRASGPVGQMFPRTFCPKLVPGLHHGYTVEVLVGTVDPYPGDCWNVAPSPLGIVYNQGE